MRPVLILESPGPDLERLTKTKQVVHITDYAAQPQQARGRLGHLGGARTVIELLAPRDAETRYAKCKFRLAAGYIDRILKKSADDYLEEAEQLRRSQNIEKRLFQKNASS